MADDNSGRAERQRDIINGRTQRVSGAAGPRPEPRYHLCGLGRHRCLDRGWAVAAASGFGVRLSHDAARSAQKAVFDKLSILRQSELARVVMRLEPALTTPGYLTPRPSLGGPNG